MHNHDRREVETCFLYVVLKRFIFDLSSSFIKVMTQSQGSTLWYSLLQYTRWSLKCNRL